MKMKKNGLQKLTATAGSVCGRSKRSTIRKISSGSIRTSRPTDQPVNEPREYLTPFLCGTMRPQTRIVRRLDVRNILVPRFLAVVLLLAVAGPFAAAQLFPGRITGTVRDSQGAAVAGATLKLSNPATGQERTLTSDQNGEFNFPELPLGTFRLSVSKEGFSMTLINDIVTSQGQVNNVNPVLAIGTVSSRVEVISTPGLVQTETNEVGGQLSQTQVESLPIGNSDYTRLALVLPGVTQNSNFAYAQYTINGSRSRSNGFNIDGVSDTDPSTYLPSINEGGNSASAATRLPLDAIQEVSVSANAGADSGQNSGSAM